MDTKKKAAELVISGIDDLKVAIDKIAEQFAKGETNKYDLEFMQFSLRKYKDQFGFVDGFISAVDQSDWIVITEKIEGLRAKTYHLLERISVKLNEGRK